ncbi:30S ribosomal protein S8 [Clostridia bacterium]|nr:30S ribosomal protein S8 [Clostridia bacterium]
MITTDPIADFLTRMRNGLTAKHDSVLVPLSREKKAIADILVEEGYIRSADIVDDEGHQNINVVFKYAGKNARVLNDLRRISKPGLRVYCSADKIPKVLNGLGIAIISTNKGIMTDKKARLANVGGEVLAYIW